MRSGWPGSHVSRDNSLHGEVAALPRRRVVNGKPGHKGKVWSNPDLSNGHHFFDVNRHSKRICRIQIWHHLIIPNQLLTKNLPSIPHTWRWGTLTDQKQIFTSYLTWRAPFALGRQQLVILDNGFSTSTPAFRLDFPSIFTGRGHFQGNLCTKKGAEIMKGFGRLLFSSISSFDNYWLPGAEEWTARAHLTQQPRGRHLQAVLSVKGLQ